MICNRCKSKLRSNAKVCIFCGKPVDYSKKRVGKQKNEKIIYEMPS